MDVALHAVDGSVSIVTLHQDGVRLWSLVGELHRHIPHTVTPRPRHHLVAIAGSTLYHCSNGDAQISTYVLTAHVGRPDARVGTIAIAGPVQCIAASESHVVVGLAPKPSRGILSVHNVATGTVTSTWLPSGRHIASIACHGDTVITADNGSTICVWLLRDITAPALAINAAVSFERVSTGHGISGSSLSPAGIRQIQRLPFEMTSMVALPSGVIEVTGTYASDPTQWTATVDLQQSASRVSLRTVVLATPDAVSTPPLCTTLRWSITTTATDKSSVVCTEFAPTR
jgi:hypothetical protein